MTSSQDPFATPPEHRDPARRLRGRLAAPVTLWTAGSEEGRAGLTVSSLVVAEGDTASVLGLINPLSELADALIATKRFVVHVLHWEHRRIAERFAGAFPSPGGRFSEEAWRQTGWGPVLSTAAHLTFCRYETTQEVGYHSLVMGTVESIELGDALDPLVYLQGRFRRLEQPGGRSPSGGVA